GGLKIQKPSFFDEEDPDLNPRSVDERWLLDLQASYDFSVLVSKTTATTDYSKNNKSTTTPVSSEMGFGDRLLDGTRITVGCTNVFDTDPPFASGQGGNAVGYPGYTYD